MGETLDVQIVKTTRAILGDDKERLCQCWGPLDRHGRKVGPSNDEAVRFCVWSALYRATVQVTGWHIEYRYEDHSRIYCDIGCGLEREVVRLYPGQCLMTVNDTLGHKAVVEVLNSYLRRELFSS